MRVFAAIFRRSLRIGGRVALVWGLCLSLSGCTSYHNFMDKLWGEGCRDETSNYCRNFRKPDPSIEAAGLSNKARDIERDLGAP